MDGNEMTLGPKPELQVARPGVATVSVTAQDVTWRLYYSFAPEWFADALNEARNGDDHHARGREIVFAVCFAESYLFEWVRDRVVGRDIQRLNQFFPSGARRGISEKWKDVPKELFEAGLIPAKPNLGRPYWQVFLELVEFRDGLIHARASRPETPSQRADERPLPSKGDLDKLSPGWAVRAVVALVQELHAAVGTSPPSWVEEP